MIYRNLYKGKVAEIPVTFSSVSKYTKSFIYPLFEETHADLLSNVLGVDRSPTAAIVKVITSKDFKLPRSLYHVILLRRQPGSYVPEVGDLVALTDVRPRCVDDLNRPNMPYLIALVQKMKLINKSLCKILVLSSKPLNTDFRMNRVKFFAVYLTNLTTNIRISRALHAELEGNTLDMIKSVLHADPSIEESCTDCSIDKARSLTLLKMKEALKTSQLDSSQEAAVLNCIAAGDCHHRNTIKLIWGPPGTGKTKTVSSLLHMLLKMKCRTLTCAPTNIAVLGVTKRVMGLVRDSFVYDTYGLGDIVLFGNGKRMKIDDCEDLSDIFLSLRVKILSDCVAPFSGWKGCCDWMIRFLEDPCGQYDSYVMQHSRDEDGVISIHSKDQKDECSIKSNNGESDDDGDCSTEFSGDEDSFIEEEEEESSDPQMKKALIGQKWKTIIVRTLEEANHYRSNKNENEKEPSSKENSNKKNLQGKVLTFEEFVMNGFKFLGNRLISYIKSLYTHMPTSFISAKSAKEMIKAVSSLQRLEELLKVAVAENSDLEKAFYGFGDSKAEDNNNLHTYRMSSIETLKYLQKKLCFPDFKEDHEIRQFCFANACLVFCTASSSINLHTEASNPLEFLVIDEAAQLKECESVIPLQLRGLRHVILVGDERQLPAMVQSKICEKAEFGRSLFERLVSLGHKKHLLEVQYRMHPSISWFPNKEFYDKRILDGVNVQISSYGKRFLEGNMYGSYSFINVTSTKEKFDKGHSMQNLMEVAVIGEIIANLFKESVARKRKVSVGCITPYKAQVNAIQQKLGNKYSGSESYFTVNVRSVDGFQGSEEDVIIISTVRCNGKGSVGFLSNRQRANVALTRARYCLWILGHGSTLTNSGSIWRDLVVDAKDRGCFYNVNDDKNLAQAVILASIEVGQFDSLFNSDSLLLKEAKWQVKSSDTFLEAIGRLNDHEISKKVVSLLIKLLSGWRELEKDGDTKVKIDGTCTIVERYRVTQDLHLIWAVDIVAQNSVCIQVLKFWDVLPGTKIDELVNMFMEKAYGNYNMNMLNRCKEKHVEGNLTLPVSWPMNSDTDQSWSLANQLAGLSLENRPSTSSSSSSRTSSGWEFGNRKSNRYGDSRSRGRGPRW